MEGLARGQQGPTVEQLVLASGEDSPHMDGMHSQSIHFITVEQLHHLFDAAFICTFTYLYVYFISLLINLFY